MNQHVRLRDVLQRTPLRPSSQPSGVGDIFKVGIGPSSSHTTGPMKAAAAFRRALSEIDALPARIVATAHGALAWTGKGHATDIALLLGLAGLAPETIDPDSVPMVVKEIAQSRRLFLADGVTIAFDPATDIVFDFGEPVGRHPNAMTFEAFSATGTSLLRERWYSVGGGFIERDGEARAADALEPAPILPYAYECADDLLALTRATGLSLQAICLANEAARTGPTEAIARVDLIAVLMLASIERGLMRRGILPGGLGVRRRAADIHAKLLAGPMDGRNDPNVAMIYVTAYAMAVNEENAAGGRVVTAPTNGAAGVIPAVLRYHQIACHGSVEDARTILLTATLVGDLIRRNASISGAEVGCQGEVGAASAMAAAGLCAALGGTPEQVLNAAEIALEHHLGLTCDPIGGLVQIPCIERNAFGAVKAINAASLALAGDGAHRVSLDQVIETMRQTGLDMKAEYRETARGGLAINVPAC